MKTKLKLSIITLAMLLFAGHIQAQGYAVVTLIADDLYEDGTGFQLLLDNTATAIGTVYNSGPYLYEGDAPDSIYNAFAYKIPSNADGSVSTRNIIIGNQQTIVVPEGIYDIILTNPDPHNSKVYVTYTFNDYKFEANKRYEFYYDNNNKMNTSSTTHIPATLPYTNNFSNTTENSQWIFNNIRNYPQWYTWYTGSTPTMLMCGRGQDDYEAYNNSTVVLAERLVQLGTSDDISIEFQLNVGGESTSSNVYYYLAVFFAPADVNFAPDSVIDHSFSYLGYSSSTELQYMLNFGDDPLHDSKLHHRDWETMKTTIKNPQKNGLYKLIFVWKNDDSDGDGTCATIDDIVINEVIYYDIIIGYGGDSEPTIVSNYNKDNITGPNILKGTIQYDAETSTLTLNNATVSGNIDVNSNYEGGTQVKDINVVLIGENTISHELYIETPYDMTSNVTITGPGSLNAGAIGLYDAYTDILIKDCSINIDGTDCEYDWGLYGTYGKNNIEIDNSDVTITSLEYGFGNFNIITLTDCKIIKPENAQILIPEDFPGNFACNADGTIANHVVIAKTSGIANNETETLNIYPNPATDYIHIDGIDGKTIKLYDNTGRIIKEEIYNGYLNIRNLASGIYMVECNGHTAKFVKR